MTSDSPDFSDDVALMLKEQEQSILRDIVSDALASLSAGADRDLLENIVARARLHRFEHGGYFVVVQDAGEWFPLDRAIRKALENPGMVPGGTPGQSR